MHILQYMTMHDLIMLKSSIKLVDIRKCYKNHNIVMWKMSHAYIYIKINYICTKQFTDYTFFKFHVRILCPFMNREF